MQKAEKLLLLAGITVGVFLLAQAAYRSGTNPIDVSTMFNGMHMETDQQKAEAKMRKFAEAAGMGWDDFSAALSEDLPFFAEGAKNTGDENNPGVSANLGGLSGRPYTIIDDEFYLMPGR